MYYESPKNPNRIPIEPLVWHHEGERLVFEKFRVIETGVCYDLDHSLPLEGKPAAAMKAGGCGILYIVKHCGKPIHIYNDRAEWFIEKQ